MLSKIVMLRPHLVNESFKIIGVFSGLYFAKFQMQINSYFSIIFHILISIQLSNSEMLTYT